MNKKKLCNCRDSNPGYMGSKSTRVSTTLWRSMNLIGKNNSYMLKLYIGEWVKCVTRTRSRVRVTR